MRPTDRAAILCAEKCVTEAQKALDGVLKGVFVHSSVEIPVGRHTAVRKVVDVEGGKLILEDGTRREWRFAETVLIFDGLDDNGRQEAG